MPQTAVIPPGTGVPLAPYVPGTLANGILYVSGTLPFDRDNNVVHVGDPAAQARHVLNTIKSVVETAGGTMAEIPITGEPGQCLLLAVGPEGGWSDYEFQRFREAGFFGMTMGSRILHVDTAVVSLLAQMQLLYDLRKR